MILDAQFDLAMDELELRGGAGPLDGFLQLRFVDDFYLDNTEDMRKLARERWRKRASALGLIEESTS